MYTLSIIYLQSSLSFTITSSYQTTMGIACTYTSVTNPAVTGPLNFWIAVDPGNMGFFANTFAARRPQLLTGPNTAVVNLIRTTAATATFNGQVSLRTDSGAVTFQDVTKSGMCPVSICSKIPTDATGKSTLTDPNGLCKFSGTMGVPLSWTTTKAGVSTVTNCAPFLTPSRGTPLTRTPAAGSSAATGESMATLYPTTTATTISASSQSLLDHALAAAMGLTRFDAKKEAKTTTTTTRWSINEGASEGAFTGNPSAQGQSALIMSFAVQATGLVTGGTTGYT